MTQQTKDSVDQGGLNTYTITIDDSNAVPLPCKEPPPSVEGWTS